MSNGFTLYRWGVLIAVVLTVLLVIPSSWYNVQYADKQFEVAQNSFYQLEEETNSNLNVILSSADFTQLFQTNELTKKGITYLLYENKKLVYWSDDKVSADYEKLANHKGRVIETGTGFYYLISKSVDNRMAIGAILVQQKFHHENNYLREGFVLSGGLDEGFNFTPSLDGDRIIKNTAGETVFSLQVDPFFRGYSGTYNVKTILFFLTVLLVSILLIIHFKRKPLYSASIFLLLLLARVFFIQAHAPFFLYQTTLFSPTILAINNWFPNLGDSLINMMLLLFFSISLTSFLKNIRLTSFIYSIAIGIIFYAAFGTTSLFRGLVIDSTVSFDLTNLFQLTIFSYIGLLVIAIGFYGIFYALNQLISFSKLSTKQLVIVAIILSILNYVVQYSMGERNILFINWPLILYLFISLVSRKYLGRYNLTRALFLILILGSIGSYILVHQTALKDRRAMVVLAQKLAEEKDPIAEYLFEREIDKIKSDTTFLRKIKTYWLQPEEIDEYILNEYFNGYWEGFEFQFTFCTATDELLIQPDNQRMPCEDFFDQRIATEGNPTGAFSLFQMQSETGRISYLSKVKFQLDTSEILLFAEFNNKRFNQNEGYPELLLAQKEISRSIDLKDFSFGKYENGKLISSVGEFEFNALLTQLNIAEGAFSKSKINYRDVLHYRVNESTVIQLVSPANNLLDRFTAFAYLFTFLAIGLFIVALILPGFPIHISWRINDFTTKIQLFIVGILLVSIGSFSVASTYYIKQQYRIKNEKNIAEKLRSVLIEVNQKLGSETVLDEALSDYMTNTLIKFSNVFYTDINLYGSDGELIATSRSEIFDIGLKASIMDDAAFNAMAIEKKQLYINNERIGGLNYLSAYVPFYNLEGNFLAYLNLPYFAKQNELEAEIASFLVSSVNIYVLIFAFSIILSVLFANYISQPLRLLREKIAMLNIGASNELIKWEGTDEIGSLVKEYNRMVVKLADSVDVLARSERAGAWKEMAKQVAHEIKNPLTPMKLSIQYLKRASDDQRQDLPERIDKTTETLIQQIDALAQIANEFSNFAKMPEPKKQAIDFLPILSNAVILYDELESITLSTELKSTKVLADKDQLLRVFNNIIKNGFQSVPEGRKPQIKITVTLDSTSNQFIIKIQDNGQGIAKEDYDRIFVPNFTSKSSGMGLGLAIVKNVVEQSNGQVYFETELGVGTTFIISLPRLAEE